MRAAQRITRNTVHSYGPATGRMDVRSEVTEFFNRDGLLDYPDSEVRFQPDEVLFTPGTRAGLAIVLEVLGADGSGVVVPRPSWEYDWFIERAGKKVVELPTAAPDFLPDPLELDRLLAGGGLVRQGQGAFLAAGRKHIAEAEPEVRSGDAVAFSVPDHEGEEMCVLMVQCRERDPAKRNNLIRRLTFRDTDSWVGRHSTGITVGVCGLERCLETEAQRGIHRSTFPCRQINTLPDQHLLRLA